MNAESSVAELEQRIATAREQGDKGAEADARLRMGVAQGVLGDLQRAEDELRHAELLHLELNQPGGQGNALYTLARLVERAPGRLHEALDLQQQAVGLARIADDLVLEMRARTRLARIREQQEDWSGAQAEVTNTIERLRELGNDRGLADVYRHRAWIRQVRGQLSKAFEDLDRACAAALASGDAELLLRARMERRALYPFTVERRADMERWEDLATDAAALGDRNTEGQVALQAAAEHLRADRFQPGLAAAQTARQAALESRDPLLYTIACMLIAEALEHMGDDAGVLGILLTCKVTLEKDYGKELGRQVVWVLDSLKDRWGAQRLGRAIQVHRDRMRQAEA